MTTHIVSTHPVAGQLEYSHPFICYEETRSAGQVCQDNWPERVSVIPPAGQKVQINLAFGLPSQRQPFLGLLADQPATAAVNCHCGRGVFMSRIGRSERPWKVPTEMNRDAWLACAQGVPPVRSAGRPHVTIRHNPPPASHAVPLKRDFLSVASALSKLG